MRKETTPFIKAAQFFIAFFALVLVTAGLRAQTTENMYKNSWKKIDSLIIKDKLPKDALTEVNKIYNLAKKENNQAQTIKALLYKIQLSETTTETTTPIAITALEIEIERTPQPAKAILQSLLAEAYWQYLQYNRWKLYDRTQLVTQKNEDINTWTAEDLHQKITALYKAALSNEKALQAIALKQYDAILIKGNTPDLRPTLYDILAFRALEYFSNQERTLTKPMESFKMNDTMAFAPAAQFANHRFITEDTASVYFQALLIYQQIIRFHLQDARPDALIDADLLRLSFVHRHATATQKRQLYIAAIQEIASQYGDIPSAAQAWYLIAEDHANKAGSYNPKTDTTNRYHYVTALSILDKVLRQKDSSEGRINSFNLRTNILRKTLQLQTELVNLPNEPFRSLVTFRNVDQVHLRIIKIDGALIKALAEMQKDEDRWNRLTALSAMASTTHQLPPTNDHQQHKTEIKLGALPLGRYAILIASDKTFTPAASLLAVQYIHISNIAYLQQEQNVFVVDRTSGKAIPNAVVETWKNTYNYETRKSVRTKLGSYYTNNSGLATIATDPKKAQSLELVVKSGNDQLHLKDQVYFPVNNQTPVDTGKNKTYFFTDRSIYRPGQTIYFKGIIVKEKSNDKQVQSDLKTTVLLYDANYTIIDSIKVTTNEFGSYAGQFKLPENSLNGYFRITDKAQNGSAGFSVEEYKRPTFSAKLKTPEGMIRLNDQVTIDGEAIAFAGNNIIDATVNYRVVRKQYMSPFLRYWPPFPARDDQEIASGTIKTDANGQFKIVFKAIADDADKNEKQISYYYEISADITDIAGETRSSTTSIQIGNKAVHLSFGLPATMPADSLNNLILHASNSGGIGQVIPVNINIFTLKTPSRTFRERFWDAPDVFILTKKEYEQSFPLDIYDAEHLPENWELSEKPVYSVSDSTTVNGGWNKDLRPLAPGWYKIEAAGTDAFGEKVTAFHYIQLTGDVETDKMFAITLDKNNYTAQPGIPLQMKWQSNFQPALIIKDTYRTGKKTLSEYITNRAKGIITLAPDTSDRGGMGLVLTTVKHNRFYQVNTVVDIPWTNKELQITTASFRDKLQPGANETWTINILPKEGKTKVAELLAGMYDASLDQFTPHRWNQPYWMHFSRSRFWNSAQNFTQTYSNSSESILPDSTLHFDKQYDILLTAYNLFGMDGIYGYTRAPQYGAIVSMSARDNAKKVVAQDSMLPNANLREEVMAESESTDRAVGFIEVPQEQAPPSARTNFAETAFFFPQLKTDANGKLSFSFTMPESLTKWKWMSFAHTADMQSGYMEQSILTQKDLMVQPNLPRFLREGDKINLSTRISNLTDQAITGQVTLQILDAITREPLDGNFQNIVPNQYFNANAGGSTVAHFSIQVPFQYSSPVVVRIIGTAGNISDGEETILPILPNTQMITETFPVFMNGIDSKIINWEKLAQSFQSETLQQHGLTVEFTSNPIWYVVQALPVLKQVKNPSVTDQFSRFYAHVMSAGIINSKPRIKAIIQEWMQGDTSVLMSQLHKNEDLKAILLEETPWVLEATNEKEQRRRLAMLLDMATLQSDLASSWKAVTALQTSNGGFSWFPGGQDNRFMTQYLLNGIGQLKKAGLLQQFEDNNTTQNGKGLATAAVIEQALQYLDARLLEDYQTLISRKQHLDSYQPDNTVVLQLYLRSFFPDNDIDAKNRIAYQYFRKQAYKYWNKETVYKQGMIALIMLRNKEVTRAGTIFKSIQQQAVHENNENGMYWKKNIPGFNWYQSNVDVQSLLIEAFAENYAATQLYGEEITAMKTWLIKQKQTTAWGNTISTAKACYALLLQGEDYTNTPTSVQVKLGAMQLEADTAEAGTGYFRVKVSGAQVTPEMSHIAVKLNANKASISKINQPVWGSIYWQYSEQMDKIVAADANKELAIQKEYFVQKNTANGPTLISITEETALKTGDKVVVRIIIHSNRDMDFVHLKDVRAAGFEPVNVLSGYQWKNGLSFYQSTKDASTQFFFDRLPKGTHVLEYSLFATHAGKFSTGTGNIQCLYAPEFSAHSDGFSIRIEE